MNTNLCSIERSVERTFCACQGVGLLKERRAPSQRPTDLAAKAFHQGLVGLPAFRYPRSGAPTGYPNRSEGITSRSSPTVLPVVGASGNHGSILGAQRRRRDDDRHGRGFLHLAAQRAVGGDAAAQQDALHPILTRQGHGLAHKHVHQRRLKGRSHLGDLLWVRFDSFLRGVQPLGLGHVEHRRLEAAEAEIVGAFEPRPRQLFLSRGPFGGPLHQRPAGEPHAQDPRHLVEGLAGGVVPGAA